MLYLSLKKNCGPVSLSEKSSYRKRKHDSQDSPVNNSDSVVQLPGKPQRNLSASVGVDLTITYRPHLRNEMAMTIGVRKQKLQPKYINPMVLDIFFPPE